MIQSRKKAHRNEMRDVENILEDELTKVEQAKEEFKREKEQMERL